MQMIKKILRKLFYLVKSKPLSEDEQSQVIIKRIRTGGGNVGENVDILSSVIDLGEPYLISIGNNVTLTTMRLLTHDASTKKELGYSKVGRVTIGDNVFVGAGTIILPDTKIGSKVIIGAGSVVSSDVPDNCVACGSPCRPICSYDDYMGRMRERMNVVPCLDLLPADLLNAGYEKDRQYLMEAGKGFIR